jgi:hypothetical protein
MKERPILFSGAMVRAILEGSKIQTRRALNPQPDGGVQFGAIATPHGVVNGNGDALICRYGHRGDRLWVRETTEEACLGSISVTRYTADGVVSGSREWDYSRKTRPSIHMKRNASRITLEIVSVWVERLNEICVTDAIDEGVEFSLIDDESAAIETFSELWESINGAGSWDANPWVWVIEFERIH